MKIVDANVLLYAANRQSAQHEAARTWLSAALNGTTSICLPWVSVLAFIRISTNVRIQSVPLTIGQARTVVDAWFSSPRVISVEPTPRHLPILWGLLDTSGAAGNLTTDAHLAALALEHRATVVSFDRDFLRFGVDLEVPLSG